MSRLQSVWKSIVNWFEIGDLVPLIVVVSAAHYVWVLADYDYWPVAAAIGIMVDLGHYRIVRAAVRYRGGHIRPLMVRWCMVVFMTVLSINYHQRFYQDWWLSLPLPFLIAALAWIQKTDEKIGKRDVSTIASQEIAHNATKPSQVRAHKTYTCEKCGRIIKKQQSYAAHVRFCRGDNNEVVTKQ